MHPVYGGSIIRGGVLILVYTGLNTQLLFLIQCKACLCALVCKHACDYYPLLCMVVLLIKYS